MTQTHPIVIIGAGITGLIAAHELETAGHSPLILEASDRAGGRLRTDRRDSGFLLDRGFQVLLAKYEEAQHYLDYPALELNAFKPGAIVFSGNRRFSVTDPLRQPDQLLPMLRSPVGNLWDKWLVYRMTKRLKEQSPAEVFQGQAQSTMEYLRRTGFSQRMIQNFFQPFFGGIFLENDLRTDAAMFRFTYKMFSEGEATLPNAGIEAIPRQLKSKLQRTLIKYKTAVQRVEGHEITLDNGRKQPFSKLIIAADPQDILPGLQNQEQAWISTTTLYFRSDASPLESPTIGLVADTDSPINNFSVLTDVAPGYSLTEDTLVSVTLKDQFEEREDLADQVIREIQRRSGKPELKMELLARYDIPHALPEVEKPVYDRPNTEINIAPDIFLAGDYLLNASLDAAMRSGRNAARAAILSF